MIKHSRKIKLESLFLLGIAVSCFPWISFGLNNMGMQPYFIVILLLSMMIYYHKYKVARFHHSIIFLPFVFILFQSLNGVPIDFLFIRDFLSYLAFSISFVFFYEYLLIYGFPKKFFYYILIIWLLACIPQYLFGEHVYSSLLFAKSSASRGFTSLASEPSFFGLHTAIICSMILLFCKKEETSKFLLLAILSLGLSGSLTAFVYYSLFISISLILTRRLNIKFFILILFSFLIAYFAILKNQRFGELINIIFDSGLIQLLVMDESSGSRIGDILTPYLLSFYNYFLPLGRVSYELDSLNFLCLSSNIFESLRSCGWIANDDKIGSYLGSIIFHFGFTIFPLICYFFFLIARDLRTVIASIIFLILIVTTIPPGYPMMAFYLAAYLFYVQKKYAIKKPKHNAKL